jgi:photosystem II stability/assembly factor-like uncharacterized protein
MRPNQRPEVFKGRLQWPVAIAALVLLLACQISPRPTPLPATVAPPLQTATASPAWTATAQPHTPTPTASVTPSPTIVPSPTPPRLSPSPTPTPPLPTGGPLPAVWKTIDLGLPGANLYGPTALAYDAERRVAVVLGTCAKPEPVTYPATYEDPPACLAELDLDSDRVLRTTAVPGSSYGRLLVAGGETYLVPSWQGTMYVLDSETLAVTRAISDVLAAAFDGVDTTYAITQTAIARLAPDPVSLPYTFSYDDTPFDLRATADGIYVLSYASFRVFSPELAPIATFDLREQAPHALAVDPLRRRAYIGCSTGLHMVDLETMRISEIPVLAPDGKSIQNLDKLALDATGERLIALAHYPFDWYNTTALIEIPVGDDAPQLRARMLFTFLEGQLAGPLLDPEGDAPGSAAGRILLASYEDHALIPIDAATGQVDPRLPLGIETSELIVDGPGGRLYASDSAGWIHVLDRRTYVELGRAYGGRYISMDSTHGRLYAGDPRVPVVTVFDTGQSASPLTIQGTIAQSGKPRADPAADRVVIINRQFTLFDGATGAPAGLWQPTIGLPAPECMGCYYTIGTEAFVDAQRGYTTTLGYTPWPGKPGPQEAIDYDPGTGRAYYALLTGGYVHYSSIAIYPDLGAIRERNPPTLSLEGLSGEIRLDPSARRLYVARGHILFVLDSETLDRIGRVETDGWQPQIVAIDDELGRLYTPRDDQVVVWTREGAAPLPPLPPEPAVVTGTVTSILASPNFAQDQTLLATIDGELCRSTDGGTTWQRLRGGLPTFGDYVPTVNAAFSPDYAHDRALFAGIFLGDSHGEGVYCSADGGDTWAMCADGLHDLRVYRVVPSPNFGQDRTLLAYARIPSGESLSRSTDGGKAWQSVLRQVSSGTPPLPLPEEMFSIAAPLPQYRCDYQGLCERSADGGETWAALSTANFTMAHLVGYALSPDFERDRTAYWLTESALFRYDDRTQSGEISTVKPVYGPRDYTNGFTSIVVARDRDGGNVLFLGSYAGEFLRFAADELGWEKVWPLLDGLTPTPTPSPAPGPSPTPTPCALPIDGRFPTGIPGSERLGCASSPAGEQLLAVQPFERGQMLWFQDVSADPPAGTVYVLGEDGTWVAYPDMWSEGQPDRDPALVSPSGRYQPVRGFGKVWREQLGGAAAEIGWATDQERGVNALIQRFAQGLLIQVRPGATPAAGGQVYLLHADGTWATNR